MRRYIIPAGKHYPKGINFDIKTSDVIEFTAKLTESCTYTLPYSDHLDLSKLVGFVDFFNDNISARIGWRYNTVTSKFTITTYIHNNGDFIPNSEIVLGEVGVNEVFRGSIRVVRGSRPYYLFILNGYAEEAVYVNKVPSKLKRVKFPYLGGTFTLPYDVVLEMDYK